MVSGFNSIVTRILPEDGRPRPFGIPTMFAGLSRDDAARALAGWADANFAVILMAMSILAEFRKHKIT
jgi:hypothetical protein